MSELFDKEVNAQKESLKNFRGSCKLPQAMKMKQRKNNMHVKMLLMENVIDGRKHFTCIGYLQKNR